MQKLLNSLILASLSSILSFTVLSANATETTTKPASNIVSLQAEAKKKSYANQATLNLVVSTENAKFTNSVKANTKLLQRFTRTLRSKKISADNIQQTQFPVTEETSEQTQSGKYRVKSRISITVDNEKQLKAVTTIVDKFKQVTFISTEFNHSQAETLKNEVRKMAIDKIMQQKSMYEKNLNVKLATTNFRDNQIGSQASKGAQAMSNKQATSFDELEYQANISVDFIVSAQ